MLCCFVVLWFCGCPSEAEFLAFGVGLHDDVVFCIVGAADVMLTVLVVALGVAAELLLLLLCCCCMALV